MNTQKIEEYLEVKANLDKYKKLESEMRVAILEEAFPNASEGTLNSFAGEYQIKGTFKMTHKLDASLVEENYDDMSKEEKECISFKPSLSLAAYKKLDEDDGYLLNECITVSPAMPSLKIQVAE